MHINSYWFIIIINNNIYIYFTLKYMAVHGVETLLFSGLFLVLS